MTTSQDEGKNVTGFWLLSGPGPVCDFGPQWPVWRDFCAQDRFHPVRDQPHAAANQNRLLDQSPIDALIQIYLALDSRNHVRITTVLPKP